VIANAYVLAGIPVAFIILAGLCSPLYRQPWDRLVRWWSWMACIVVASAAALTLV
jgi:hypothetical protein